MVTIRKNLKFNLKVVILIKEEIILISIKSFLLFVEIILQGESNM